MLTTWALLGMGRNELQTQIPPNKSQHGYTWLCRVKTNGLYICCAVSNIEMLTHASTWVSLQKCDNSYIQANLQMFSTLFLDSHGSPRGLVSESFRFFYYLLEINNKAPGRYIKVSDYADVAVRTVFGAPVQLHMWYSPAAGNRFTIDTFHYRAHNS